MIHIFKYQNHKLQTTPAKCLTWFLIRIAFQQTTSTAEDRTSPHGVKCQMQYKENRPCNSKDHQPLWSCHEIFVWRKHRLFMLDKWTKNAVCFGAFYTCQIAILKLSAMFHFYIYVVLLLNSWSTISWHIFKERLSFYLSHGKPLLKAHLL